MTLPEQAVGIVVGQLMKEGDSWGWDGLSRTGEKTESRGVSGSVMETVERREEDSCCCVDHTLLTAHIS